MESRTCPECGSVFEVRRGGGKRKYCGSVCAAKATSARREVWRYARHGNAFAQDIEAAGMTQHELAIKASVSQSSISRYVTGNRRPRIDIAFRLACALGVNAGELWRGCEDEEETER